MLQRLLFWIADFAVGIFYRREILGAEVPRQGPVILVGNHPNGLVDPILLAACSPRPVRFLGKAPLFRLPVVGTFMRGMRALPVYRRQDGADTSQNQDTFDAVFSALEQGQVICLFPEGLSHSEPHLKELKTGAARMALGSEARSEFAAGVRIVPVGLHYRSNRRFRSRVAVWVGEPIDASQLKEAYARDEVQTVQALTETIAAGLGKVMLQLDRWEDLPLLELAESLFPKTQRGRLERIQRLAEGLRRLRAEDPEALNELTERIAAFGERLERLGIDSEDLTIDYRWSRVLGFALRNLVLGILGVPLGLLGLLVWGPPYLGVPWIPRLARPSRAIYPTVQILAGMVLFPVWYALLVWGAQRFLGTPWASATAVGAPVVGLFALRFREWRRETLAECAVFLRSMRAGPLRAHLLEERQDLATQLRALAERIGLGSAQEPGERP